MFTFPTGDLFTSIRGVGTKQNTSRSTFTFRADKLSSTTNKQFRIEGVISVGLKAGTYGYNPFFNAQALVKNLKVYRGNKAIADAHYVDAQYTVKEYSTIPAHEKENHSIGEPSPPDQWFIKFSPTTSALSSAETTSELSMLGDRGGGGTIPIYVRPEPEPDDPPPPPPPPPPPLDIDDTDNTDDQDDIDDGIDEDGGTTIIDDEDTPSTVVSRLSRLLVTNRIDLQPDSIYRFHVIINRVKNDNADNVLKVNINPSLEALRPAFAGTYSTTGIQHSIDWEIDTAGIAAADLRGIYFQIDAFEEDIIIANAAVVYISDVNILGKISELPINTIYRFDGEVWDNAITQLSNDDGILNDSPHSLIESYEVNSEAQRLYCISGGNIYVWGTGPNDPYGGLVSSRIVVSW